MEYAIPIRIEFVAHIHGSFNGQLAFDVSMRTILSLAQATECPRLRLNGWPDGMIKGFDLLPDQSAKGCRRIASHPRGHTHCTPLTMNQNVRSPLHVNPFCVLILLSPIFRTESQKIAF